MMSAFSSKYGIFKNKKVMKTSIEAILFLIASLIVNFYAVLYATERASNSVTDIVLSNIPPVDVDGIFIYGSFVFWFFVFLICLYVPRWIPFTAKSIAIFVLIRSVFISLTHIGPFPTQIPIDPASFINYFSSGGDLFFSAHTGLPFLMALIFWKNIKLRYFFLISAVIFGVVVLLGHLHYSIDVISAFFITYSIFKISEYIFEEDRKIFFGEI